MGLSVMASAIAGAIFQGPKFGFGVVAGGLLALANFAWLDRSTGAIFRRAAEGYSGAGIPALTYVLRYFVLGGALLVIYLTDALPVAAVILGLSAFAAAVLADGLYRLFNKTR
jgi:hypothetical protein